MSKRRPKYKYYVADTESTQPHVFQDSEAQPDVSDFKTTRVWICGYLNIDSTDYESDIKTFDNISHLFDSFKTLNKRYTHVIYFHNLGWDVSYILPWLKHQQFEQFYQPTKFKIVNNRVEYEDKEPLSPHQFEPVVASNRTWYALNVCLDNGVNLEFRDSFKILPFTLDKISKDINHHYKKQTGTIDYTKDRSDESYQLTPQDIKYFNYDLFSLAEALKELKNEDVTLLKCLTVGQYAMKYFKNMVGKKYLKIFPRLDLDTDKELRKAYKGGWCYVACGNETQVGDGVVYDVNSLYPSVMHHNVYPVGEPVKVLNNWNYNNDEYLYITKIELLTCKLKDGCYPWLQRKANIFGSNEYVTRLEEPEEFTLTQPDFELLNETYDIQYHQIKTWIFKKGYHLFTNYVDHFMNMKLKAVEEGNKTRRTLAKLGANNLYGKMAQFQRSEGGLVDFSDDAKCYSLNIIEDETMGGYIPIGAFITAYARGVTVRAANSNYGKFLYSDTDSVHLMGRTHNLEIDASKIGAWKPESYFTRGKYLRQKTYIEYHPETGLNIRASGATPMVKERLQYQCSYFDGDHWHFKPLTANTKKRTIDDFFERFKIGLRETGKLRHKDLATGSILIPSTFTIKKG